MDINIYKDIEFSMKDLEKTLVDGIKAINGQNCVIKSIVRYDGIHRARIDYFALEEIMANSFPNILIVNDNLYIAKQIDDNCYRFKLASEKEIDITEKKEMQLEQLISEGKIIPIGMKYITITDKNQLYDLLFDSTKNCNYLDYNKPFFIYSKEFDELSDKIVEFAEKKKSKQKTHLS